MEYQIIYDPDKNKKFPAKKRQSKSAQLLLTLLLLTIVLVIALNTTVKQTLKSIFLPGDPDVTETAIVNLVENIKEGKTVKDAITAFCVEILEEGTK